ncbi:MAG: NAD(P)/FAD-dependent oxidoreductase [Cyanobacterium sp. T60_A2020_053]|nr:NAD(P)/FAD-dependent oxidoreductase [Cyanobacterium sp. T60_A2020_053]
MILKYDLIIIGINLTLIKKAQIMAKKGARIAIISPVMLDSSEIDQYIFQYLQPTLFDLKNFDQRQEILLEYKSILVNNYLATLSELGIHFINESFTFIKDKKKLTITTNHHILQAKSYLLADLPYQTKLSSQFNFSEQKYLTIWDIFNYKNLDLLGNKLVIIGSDIIAINLAEILVKKGKNVTLLTPNSNFLPAEDDDISYALECRRGALGIKIVKNSPLTQIKNIENITWLQIGDYAVETEQIIITEDCLTKDFNLDKLGLNHLKINNHNERIMVNSKLQTSEPSIYVCGSMLGGYNCDNLTDYEANIAIDNCLFLPINQVDYTSITYQLNTNPKIHHVGLTESQGKSNYAGDIQVLKVNFNENNDNYLSNQTGLVKLILASNHLILGCHTYGLNQPDLINIISLMIKEKKKITYLFNYNFREPILRDIVINIENQWLINNQKNINWETWLIWTRI